jgi:predicted nucleotide-binding protein
LGERLSKKLEEESKDTDFVFVLLTPDDKEADTSDSDDAKRRARQNVIFEMGYFLGQLTRRTGRVVLLHKGPIELPSDIAGLVYVDISHGIESASDVIHKEITSLLVPKVSSGNRGWGGFRPM